MRKDVLTRCSIFLFLLLACTCESLLFAVSKDGRIERVDGKFAIISLGEHDGVKQDLRGEIFRDELVEGQLITSKVGEFIVTVVYPDSSKIAIRKKFAVVERDDKVRVENVKSPPELMFISDQIVHEDSLLTFVVSAQDPDGDELLLSALDLPPGSSFTPSTGEFLWSPTIHQSGSYSIRFSVSDGTFEDIEDVSIYVIDFAPHEKDMGKSGFKKLVTNKWFLIAAPIGIGSAVYLTWFNNGTGPDDGGVIYIKVNFP